ncbi:MoaD/ThiS family protein [Roseateles saccharophilus]|uniref:Molybdopterin synthase sulfur carrier subunit n=1 Tax=Roseateles saccharophilus TaxID=304 RepID=A0A4R3UPI2_ROSSA|nr:molybdopterin synthase subunit MoaD [Roseateles saccharophilus]
MTITVRLRFFASLREKLGEGEALALPAGSTVGAAREALQARGGLHAEALARGRAVRAALNQKMAPESAVLADGDELAFFPPVTGG